MISLNISIVLFVALIVSPLSYGRADSDSADDIVPDEPPMQDLESEQRHVSKAAVDEYMREHQETKHPHPNSAGKLKRVFNKFGNIVDVPDSNAGYQEQGSYQSKVGKPSKNADPKQYPYPFPYNPYAMPGMNPMNPYNNQMMQMMGQMQRNADSDQTSNNRVAKAMNDALAPEAVLPNKTQDIDIPMSLKDYKKMMQKQQMSEHLQEYQKLIYERATQMQELMREQNKTDGSAQGYTPIQNYMPNAYPMPSPYGHNPFMPGAGSPYQVNRANMKVMPMPYGSQGVIGMDPKILKQLESGTAQLDMDSAQIIPMDDITTTEEAFIPTESDTIEDNPEIPEVVVPEPTSSTTKAPKQSPTTPKGKKKPKFLMRARLKNLPQKGDKSRNGTAWWELPAPDYCVEEEIREITYCPSPLSVLEKRWSFEKRDQKCYYYEDKCHTVKRNTFKTLKACMETCWRP